MVIIRPNLFVASLMHLDLKDAPYECSTTRLGDWTATQVNSTRYSLILLTSQHARLSVVIAQEPIEDLPERLTRAVCKLLERYEIDYDMINSEFCEMKEYYLAKPNCKSVVGIQTTLKRLIEPMIEKEGLTLKDLEDISFEINRQPVKCLEYYAPFQIMYEAFNDERSIKRLRVTNTPPKLYLVR